MCWGQFSKSTNVFIKPRRYRIHTMCSKKCFKPRPINTSQEKRWGVCVNVRLIRGRSQILSLWFFNFHHLFLPCVTFRHAVPYHHFPTPTRTHPPPASNLCVTSRYVHYTNLIFSHPTFYIVNQNTFLSHTQRRTPSIFGGNTKIRFCLATVFVWKFTEKCRKLPTPKNF